MDNADDKEPEDLYITGRALHAAVGCTGMPLAFELYWLFPITTYFIWKVFLKKSLRVFWSENYQFRKYLSLEIFTCWVILAISPYLPSDGWRELFVLSVGVVYLISIWRVSVELEKKYI